MGGHARVGRTYAGRVLQLITGSTGLDDWEWGVTLLADDPVALKEIVYEMRFDPVSADYAEFGPFVTGLLLEPAEALRARRPRRDASGVAMSEHVRLFVSFPEELVDRPMIYEVVKRFDVVPNIRRANVEAHSGWVILELTGSQDAPRRRDRLPRRGRLHGQHAWKATSSRDDVGPPATTTSRRARAAGRGGRRHRRRRRARAPRLGRASVVAHPRRLGPARRRRRAPTPAERDAVASAAAAATGRVVAELRALFALDPAEQRATPLRSCAARTASPPRCWPRPGCPPVERDEFDERAWPDDGYGLVIRTPRRPRRRRPRRRCTSRGAWPRPGAAGPLRLLNDS